MSKNIAVQEWTRADIDKSEWGPGPWQAEPDKVQWVDEATGLDCLIVRQPHSGHLCGYVGVGPDHPCHGKDYSGSWDGEVYTPGPVDDIDVHGGLTFSAACAESEDPAKGICHVALPGRPEHVWWFGFDCAHSGDYSPYNAILEKKNPVFARGSWEQYRTRGYVEAEIRRLADQLFALAQEPNA